MIGQIQRLKEINRLKFTSDSGKGKNNIISFISGKGGTGKSTLALNISRLLAERGFKVLLVDMDLGMPNLHLLLNINADVTISEYFENLASFDALIYKHSPGLNMILGDSGGNLCAVEEFRIHSFLQKIENIAPDYDFVLLDNPAGITSELKECAQVSDSNVIVSTTEPTAVMDAYVMIKHLKSVSNSNNFNVIVNKCKTVSDGKKAFNNLTQAVNYFLKSNVSLLETLEFSEAVRRASAEQTFVKNISSNCGFMLNLQSIASKLAQSVQVANNNQVINPAI